MNKPEIDVKTEDITLDGFWLLEELKKAEIKDTGKNRDDSIEKEHDEG